MIFHRLALAVVAAAIVSNISHALVNRPLPAGKRLHTAYVPFHRVATQRMPSTFGLRPTMTQLWMSNIDSDDPFQVLGLDEPTSDKKVIKRAYKRMALKFHPDVVSNQSSTVEEKKQASDRFAKINWAYEVLSGKRQNDSTYSKSTSSSSSTGSSGWTPPHRRSGAYSTETGGSAKQDYGAGVDWTDFMPKYDDADYDAAGDSFSKIFSDLLVGVAAGAAGMGGSNVFRDFIEFLEGNVDGFGDDDAELRVLLQTGSLNEIRNELDDTELVVRQLKQKLTGIQDDIVTLTARFQSTLRYMEKIEIEESLAELNARKDVVSGYVKKAQKRLLALQTRYKELLTRGDAYASGGRSGSSSWQDIRNEATGGYDSSASSSYRGTSSTSSSSSSAGSFTTTSDFSSRSQRDVKSEEDSWMNESFGSSPYGRGRGSGRRISRQSSTPGGTTSSSSQQQTSPPTDAPGASRSYSSNVGGSSSPGTSSSTFSSRSPGSAGSSTSSSQIYASSALRDASSPESNIPPHRRTKGYYENQQEKDKKRLRELKVDEEFDKLKKELGL